MKAPRYKYQDWPCWLVNDAGEKRIFPGPQAPEGWRRQGEPIQPAPPAEAASDEWSRLAAEAEREGLKVDKRWSVETLERKYLEHLEARD